MGWHDLPCDIRVHLLREVVAIPYYNEDDDVLWSADDKETLGYFEENADQEEMHDWEFDDGPLWHDVVINTMLVCSRQLFRLLSGFDHLDLKLMRLQRNGT